MRKIIFFILTTMILVNISFAWDFIQYPENNNGKPVIIGPDGKPLPDLDEEIPELPFVPTVKEFLEEEDGVRELEKTFTVMLQAKVNVFVPLEILSDIDLKATVIDDQKIKVPFDIMFNREPKKDENYMLRFSENEIDIDNDGNIDTTIYAPAHIKSKIITESYVEIEGSKISKEGKHKKRVYITVEVPDGYEEQFL